MNESDRLKSNVSCPLLYFMVSIYGDGDCEPIVNPTTVHSSIWLVVLFGDNKANNKIKKILVPQSQPLVHTWSKYNRSHGTNYGRTL